MCVCVCVCVCAIHTFRCILPCVHVLLACLVYLTLNLVVLLLVLLPAPSLFPPSPAHLSSPFFCFACCIPPCFARIACGEFSASGSRLPSPTSPHARGQPPSTRSVQHSSTPFPQAPSSVALTALSTLQRELAQE
mgnify:CR=1 FL=1